MRSFIDLDKTFSTQPRDLGVALARIDVGKGQERLFEDQAPALLERLAHDARIASITASNAIEGVVLKGEAAERIADGSSRFRNRNEKEFAGYRDATDSLMHVEGYQSLSVPFALGLHRQLFQHTSGRGGYLKTDQNLIVSYENGRRETIFTPPPPAETEFLLTELFIRYESAKHEARTHPVVLIAALVLDLLAIHPVADGNGRLSRLLTMHELLANAYGVARYISVEQLIYESKNSYYAALYESQQRWREGEHSIWPWATYFTSILAEAYALFEQRVASADRSTSKQDRVRSYVLEQAPEEFRWRDVERAVPDVSSGTIRLVLNDLRDKGTIKAVGSGPAARWHRIQ